MDAFARSAASAFALHSARDSSHGLLRKHALLESRNGVAETRQQAAGPRKSEDVGPHAAVATKLHRKPFFASLVRSMTTQARRTCSACGSRTSKWPHSVPCAYAKRLRQSACCVLSVYTTCSGLRDQSSTVRALTHTAWRSQETALACCRKHAPFEPGVTGVDGSTVAQPS